MYSAKTGLINTYLSVETSKPKQPGDVPDFIVDRAFESSSTVIAIPNVC
jgi:hypothetical protein